MNRNAAVFNCDFQPVLYRNIICDAMMMIYLSNFSSFFFCLILRKFEINGASIPFSNLSANIAILERDNYICLQGSLNEHWLIYDANENDVFFYLRYRLGIPSI